MPPAMAVTYANLTSSEDAAAHPVVMALLGLGAHGTSKPRYIGLRVRAGAQPPQAVVGVCGAGAENPDACPGHLLPDRLPAAALVCCMSCHHLIGSKNPHFDLRSVGARLGVWRENGWFCQKTCVHISGGAPPPTRLAPTQAFDTLEAASADECVRQALGIANPAGGGGLRARWLGLRLDTRPDGGAHVVGVCFNAQNPERGCPGHDTALASIGDATACCLRCGRTVASRKSKRLARRDVTPGRALVGSGGEVVGWICERCRR